MCVVFMGGRRLRRMWTPGDQINLNLVKIMDAIFEGCDLQVVKLPKTMDVIFKECALSPRPYSKQLKIIQIIVIFTKNNAYRFVCRVFFLILSMNV